MSLSGHVHHFALVISIYDIVIFIDDRVEVSDMREGGMHAKGRSANQRIKERKRKKDERAGKGGVTEARCWMSKEGCVRGRSANEKKKRRKKD